MMKQIKIPFTRTLILIFLSLQNVSILSAQTLSKGQYSFLEKMTVARDEGGIIHYIPGIYPTLINLNRPNKQWYHKTTLLITDTSSTVKKEPVYISNEKINYSDSSGGFYYYNVKLYKTNDTTIKAGGWMKECKYCPNYGTGTPRYIRLFFVIHFNKKNLTVDTDFEKGLIFKKEK